MNSIKQGNVVKFKDPLPDEDPNQLYVVLEILKGERTDAKIMALGTSMKIAPVNVVPVEDLVVTDINTKDLLGQKVSIKKENNSIVQGVVIASGKETIQPKFTDSSSGHITTNLTVFVKDKDDKIHKGLLIV